MACPRQCDPAARLVLRLHVVWVVGFEPTAFRSQAGCSAQAELHPGVAPGCSCAWIAQLTRWVACGRGCRRVMS